MASRSSSQSLVSTKSDVTNSVCLMYLPVCSAISDLPGCKGGWGGGGGMQTAAVPVYCFPHDGYTLYTGNSASGQASDLHGPVDSRMSALSADTPAQAQPEKGLSVVFCMAYVVNAYCQTKPILRRASVGQDRVGVGKADPEGLTASAQTGTSFRCLPEICSCV